MSKAARMNPVKAVMADKYEMPTTLHINLKKFKGLDDYDIGHKCNFSGTGVVRSISKSKDGDSRMEIEVSSLQKGDSNGKAEKEEKGY